MREEWWLERHGDVWVVTGHLRSGEMWCRPASEIEIALWRRWKHADGELAMLNERLCAMKAAS